MNRHEMAARLETAERQNRWMKRGGAFLIMAILSSWFVGSVSSQESEEKLANPPSYLISESYSRDVVCQSEERAVQGLMDMRADKRLVAAWYNDRTKRSCFAFETGRVPTHSQTIVR